MKILINGTTLVMGGALQVCVNVIAEASKDKSNRWFFALSPAVMRELDRSAISIAAGRHIVLKDSPSGSQGSRRRLKRYEVECGVDAVFTVFGPAYVSFEAPHLMGVADGWVTHSGWEAYKSLGNIYQYLRKPLLALYKGWWYRKATAWVVETEVAAVGLSRRWKISPRKISVVPNNCGEQYRKYSFREFCVTQKESVHVLVFSAYYAHKNIEIVPRIAKVLANSGAKKRFFFHLTLNQSSFGWKTVHALAKRLGVESCIINHGPVAIADGPELYNQCDMLLLPSLLETFSACYPEAMAAGRPIVTSDLPFAHSICQNAAVYFPPNDSALGARVLDRLAADDLACRALIENGKKRLALFPNANEKFRMYDTCIRGMLFDL